MKSSYVIREAVLRIISFIMCLVAIVIAFGAIGLAIFVAIGLFQVYDMRHAKQEQAEDDEPLTIDDATAQEMQKEADDLLDKHIKAFTDHGTPLPNEITIEREMPTGKVVLVMKQKHLGEKVRNITLPTKH